MGMICQKCGGPMDPYDNYRLSSKKGKMYYLAGCRKCAEEEGIVEKEENILKKGER